MGIALMPLCQKNLEGDMWVPTHIRSTLLPGVVEDLGPFVRIVLLRFRRVRIVL